MQFRRLESGLGKRRAACVAQCVFVPVLWLGALQATAQSAAPASKLLVQPRISLSSTLTDNLRLRDEGKDAALITTISPGLSVSSGTGRVRGSLDYSLNGVIYTKSEASGQVQNNLAAKLSVEAIDNWFYVDAQASVGQQAVSAFGTQSTDPTLRSGNSSEVARLNVSPYIRGQLAGIAGYQVSANLLESRAKDSLAGDASSRSLSMQLNGLSAGSLLNWSASLSDQLSQARGGREVETQSATATLVVRPDVDWNFGVTGGAERQNFESLAKQSSTIYGVNAGWTPTVRTKLAAEWTHRRYGNSHSLTFEHRMARSVWRLTDSQSVNTGGLQGQANVLSNYELFYIQFSSIEPDPVRRDLLVRSFLRNLGLDPNALPTGGFLGGGASLTRSQALSLSVQGGPRTTLTMTLSQTKNRNLDQDSPANGDLSRTGLVNQRMMSVSLAHRLTPNSSANMLFSQQRSRGAASGQQTDMKSLTANWNGKLGVRTNVQFGLRHTRFDSPSQPYRESAATATLVQQF